MRAELKINLKWEKLTNKPENIKTAGDTKRRQMKKYQLPKCSSNTDRGLRNRVQNIGQEAGPGADSLTVHLVLVAGPEVSSTGALSETVLGVGHTEGSGGEQTVLGDNTEVARSLVCRPALAWKTAATGAGQTWRPAAPKAVAVRTLFRGAMTSS